MSQMNPPRPSWRTLPMLLALALPSVAAACSPVQPIIQMWVQGGYTPPQGWEVRPCSADWQARAGRLDVVECYRLAAGTSPVRIAEAAFNARPDLLTTQNFGPKHQRISFGKGGGKAEVLDIHDKGAQGVFVNYVWHRPAEDYLRGQLGAVANAAQKPNAEWAALPPAWLSWLLGPERKPCSEFAPVDSDLFASCTVEQRRMRFVDVTSATSETKLAPLVTFQLKPNAKLPADLSTRQPYAARPAEVCDEVRVYGLDEGRYADVWGL